MRVWTRSPQSTLDCGHERAFQISIPEGSTPPSSLLYLEVAADLVAHGLIRSNFVPPAPIQALRDLTRTRKQLVRERGQHVQRIQKVLEDANMKLASVLSDITGKSGRAVLDALVRGETDPERLADLMMGRLKVSRTERTERVDALWGRVNEHHRFLLRLHLAQIDSVNAAVEAVEGRIEDALASFRTAYERLLTMPGVSATVAAVIVAEIGVDMSRFSTHGHLLSWAGLCPRNDESAGKRKSHTPRRQEGHSGGRRFDAHGRLLHAPE